MQGGIMQSYRYLPVLLLFSSALAYADSASDTHKVVADKISQSNAPRGIPAEMLEDPEEEEVVASQQDVVSTVEVSKEDIVEAESQEKQAGLENVANDDDSEASADKSSSSVIEDIEVKIDVEPLGAAEIKEEISHKAQEESNPENEGVNSLGGETLYSSEPITESSSDSVEAAEHLPSNAVDDAQEEAAQKQEDVKHLEEPIEASQKESDTSREEIVSQQEEAANVPSQEEDESEDQDIESEEVAEVSVDEDAVDSDKLQVDEPDLAAMEENFKEELKQVFNQGVEELLKKYPQLNEQFNGTFNIHYTYISPEKDNQEQEVEKVQ